MMKKLFFYFFLALLFSTAGAQSCSEIRQNLSAAGDDDNAVIKTLHGVCRQNLQQVKQPAKVEEIAAHIDSADIPLVRISGVKAGGSIQQVIGNINTFAANDIKVLVAQPMWMDMFPEGYEQVPGPNFKLYRMCDIDTVRFRTFMTRLVSAIAGSTADSAVIGLELFNEANWGDFNGDLQPTADGKGEVFTLSTPLTKPAFAPVYAGIIKYGKCLEITREILDQYFPEKNVKLISTGLAAGAPWNNYTWLVDRGISLAVPDLFLTLLQGKHPEQPDTVNYLQFADGIGLHCYPPPEEDMTDAMNAYYFNPINAVLDAPKPYWITEWGFARPQFENNGGEAVRLQHINSFVDATETIGTVEVATFFEFDATTNHNIWENGALLLSGTFFQHVNN